MNQIEWILYLLRDDLDDRQAAKLQSVLENVLQVHRSIPPLDDILGRFERAKRIVGIKDTTLKQYSIEVRSLARYIDKPLCIVTSSDIKDYLARYMEERNVSSVTIQNKLHFAIHGHTAAEIIIERASAEKEHMGLTSWKKAPDGKIMKSDVSVAKNYLSLSEIDELNRIVTLYLDYAELQARRRIPMTMEDWATRLNAFLQFNEREILDNPGKVSAEVAKTFAESEYEKYRVTQDRLYRSDFDKLVGDLGEQ